MKPAPLIERILQAVPRFSSSRILVLGDLMLDHYLMGDVERISPEGPVPVVKVRSEGHTLGGAGNVARNLAALGARPSLVSVCGDDDPGKVLLQLVDREGIASVVLRDPTRPTTIKTRIIAQNQQVARVDRESSEPVGEVVRGGLARAVADLLPGHDAVVVSDYAKGVVSGPLVRELVALAATLDPRPIVLVDPKVPNRDFYQGVDLLTPNAKEAGEMAGMRLLGRTDIIRAGVAIFKRSRCRSLLITLGAEGIALFDGPGLVRHIPTVARKVFDVTGAGDTVIAALAAGLTSGLDLLEACVLANSCAGIVVGQVGGASVTPRELCQVLADLPETVVDVWLRAGAA
ncbi:D-glycero-beta-D-manno-heptose-7-phosphate kinase [Desulfolutivibrio sulfoxidireducens]|uniref:D-glycero-beta-D-manno-heptose-7-phosphate kinase n=1 Tax=Desulfolutivibrio sulfoxidireducens TaxID=2773299 RepID=UPI00159CF2B3|nr:D-glycero-beta-D-manno-heptose-7-phosphate kinase [Desulfolutivibrio sulfoxidireducens]QLA14689.1 D-glycero-beta-D-manno-heptose-7-phosphate kinase [Desulfolutivibrio sulfoxidireducens]